MENKNILTRLIYLGLAVVIFFVEQLPVIFVDVSQRWQVSLLTLVILAICAVTVYIAYRIGLLEGFRALANGRAWQTILLGFLALYLVKFLGGVLLALEGLDNTSNQELIQNAGMDPMVLVVFTVIAAPIVEETVFRGLLMGRVFGSQSILGLVVSSLLFGLIHIPDSIGAWIIYGGMGLVLGLIYRKTEKLEYVIMAHFLNNGLAVALMLLLTLFIQ